MDRRAPRVAYLVNQYPKVSHAFIRREILDLERQGVVVERFALRGWDAKVEDPDDVREQKLTRYVLKDGLGHLIAAVAATFARRPVSSLKALAAAMSLATKSERSLPYHLIYFAHACRMLSWLKRSGITHLHTHFGTNATEVALLVRALGGPQFSFTVHGPEEFDAPRALALDRKIADARFVVAISSYCRSQLLRWSRPTDWSKIKIVHCGVDNGFYQAAAPRPTDPSNHFVCVGRLAEQKGQMLLLPALRALLDRGYETSLVLAGDGEMRDAIEQAIRALGLQRHVRITGAISSAEVRNEMLAARALVLPSLAEGLPVVIMEAMSLRRPVISTYVGAIPELVVPGSTGWLVPAGSTEDLRAAMESCLTLPSASLRHMGDRACERVLERHTIRRETAKLAELFAQALPAGET